LRLEGANPFLYHHIKNKKLMKTYPKIDWQELSKEQKEKFDKIETNILWNAKVLEWTDLENDIEVIAYNSALSELT